MKRRARPIVQYTVFLLFLVNFHKKMWHYNMCSLELRTLEYDKIFNMFS